MLSRVTSHGKQGQALNSSPVVRRKAWPCMTLADSFIGRISQRLSYPIISEFLLLTSVLFFWYEGALSTRNLATTLLVLALIFTDKSKIRIDKSTTYLIFFFVGALVSGVFAVSRGIDLKLIVFGWSLFVQFLIAILVAQGVTKPIRLLKNIIYISIPMIIVGGYQFFNKQVTSSLWVTPAEASISTRAFAFFGSPNVLGVVLAITALVAGSLYLQNKDKFMLIVSILATITLGFTFSRSAWLGFIAGVAVIIIAKNWKFVVFAPFTAVILLSKQVRDRIVVIFSPNYLLDSSLDGRLWSINNGFHIWSKYPILGTGPGTYGGKLALNHASPVYLEGIQNGYVSLYFTDNQWLQLLVQTGIVGVVLFALFAVNVFVELLRRYNIDKHYLPLGVIGAFTAFLVAGAFGNVLEYGAIAVPMGIMIGVAYSDQ